MACQATQKNPLASTVWSFEQKSGWNFFFSNCKWFGIYNEFESILALVWLYWTNNDFNIHARAKENEKKNKNYRRSEKNNVEKNVLLWLCNKSPLCLCQHFLRKGQFTHQFNLLKYHVFFHHHQHRRVKKMSACICGNILSVLQTMHELFFFCVCVLHTQCEIYLRVLNCVRLVIYSNLLN